jgi:chaperone modulatory protein CbpM
MTVSEVLWLDEHQVVSLAELVEVSGLSEAELIELVHVGVLPVRETGANNFVFAAHGVTVARTACRLRDDLELDTHGLGVALRLLQRVADLEREIARLRALTPPDRN